MGKCVAIIAFLKCIFPLSVSAQFEVRLCNFVFSLIFSLEDILYGVPYKVLDELRSTRRTRLMEEQKGLEKEAKMQESQRIRDQIMRS